MSNSHTVCPPGWTQNGEECQKTVEHQETCYLDGTGTPPCFGQGGSTGGGGIPEPSIIVPGKVPDLQTQCSEILQGYHDGIIQNIRELQAYERALFNKLQALETSQVSPDSQSTIIANINTVSRTRTNLFNELQVMLQQEQCALSNDRYDLADQIALLNVTEAELNRIKEQIQSLKQRRVNKIRMVEITNYETDRYATHRNIFRNVAFCALGVIFSLYLVNRGWNTLGKMGVILSIGAGVILTIKSIFDAWWRSPMNWNRYQQPGGKGGKDAGDTVWAHDVNAFWKGVGEAKLATDMAMGEAGRLSSILGGEVSDAASALERGTKTADGGAVQPHTCANEHGICPCNGMVKFGVGNKWSQPKRVNGSIQCNDSIFGDPAPGDLKTCVCAS